MREKLQGCANRMDGLEYGDDPRRFMLDEDKEDKIVIVYGASDDLMEFEGAIRDEIGAYNGGTAYINQNGLFFSECEDEDCPYAEREMEKCKTIKAVWHNGNGPAWTYETEIPHETFEIMEDGEVYCRGIVFSLDWLEA